MSRRVAKGDFIMVPEGTPHWLSAIDGTVVLISLHLPRAPQRCTTFAKIWPRHSIARTGFTRNPAHL